MCDVLVRRYEERDLDNVYEMIKKSFLTPELDKVYEDEVKAFWLSEYTRENIAASAIRNHFYVAEMGGEIVGSGAIGIDGEQAYISAVFVNPLIQGKGIGKKIIRALEQDEICDTCKKLYLTASLSAGKFYKKLGYTFKYEVPEIVVDGCLDVVYMEKELTEA